MQALFTNAPGGWENTALVEKESPIPDPNQVLVEIRCAGINPADDFLVQGRYPSGPKPPFVSGRDGSGVVVQGDQAGRWKPGDEVVILQHANTDLANGTFTQRQVFAPESLAKLPSGWSFAEGAAAPLVYQTAWRALVDIGKLQPGMRVAVTGASGGVGSAAVQLAHRLGATVLAFSRSEEKRQRLRDLGVDYVLAPGGDEVKKNALAAVEGKGFDIVVENIGGDSLGLAVHLLGTRGKVCVVGLLAGVTGPIPIPSLLFKQASIEGVLVYGYTAEEAQTAWQGIIDTLAKHGDRPIIDSVFTASDYQTAFAKLRSNTFGKVVLQF